MIEVSLTEFVDFVSKAGSPKLTVVRNVKKRHQEQYDPLTDFYKRFRDAVVRMHKEGLPKSSLNNLLDGLTHKSKQAVYPLLVQGYQKFLGKKATAWISPPRRDWTHGDLEVSLNPEVGLEINGQRHFIKLYLKEEQLTKLRMAVITHLLMSELPAGNPLAKLGILDVRKAKLIPADNNDPGLRALLVGEAASFVQVYQSIS